jgi:acylphosphatase
MSSANRQLQIRYEGEVQGVGFRYTICRLVDQLGGITGGVKNCPDGSVLLVAEAPENQLKQLRLQIQTSRLGAYITDEQVAWGDAEGLSGFYYR